MRIIRNHCNLGFAAANNLGAGVAVGDLLHFLNPDTLLTPEMNPAYREALSTRQSCIFVTSLKDAGGAAVKSRHLLPLLTNYARALLPVSTAANWYTGASVLVSREVFQALGQWPTDYFMYAEDLDLFYRAASLKIPVVSLNATVIHTGSGCTGKVWNHADRVFRRQVATKRFYCKYGRLFEYYCITIMIALRDLFCAPRSLAPYVRAAWRVERDSRQPRRSAPARW